MIDHESIKRISLSRILQATSTIKFDVSFLALIFIFLLFAVELTRLAPLPRRSLSRRVSSIFRSIVGIPWIRSLKMHVPHYKE